jgi:uncharacterized DUF497 family protein
MRDDDFEWDDAKAAANLARHGISFETARKVFKDPIAVDESDSREEYGEDRFTLIGMADGRLLLVAYTMREDRIRIISARGAEPYEHRLYHEKSG